VVLVEILAVLEVLEAVIAVQELLVKEITLVLAMAH
jgi:hypothetical protein